VTDEYGDQYEFDTFVRRVLSVIDPPLRRRQVERHLLTVDAATVSEHLQELFTRAARGDADASAMLMPLALFVQSAGEHETLALEAIDLAARREDRHAVAWFLLDPPPSRVIEERAMARMTAQSQSLGHRKAAAARSDPATLERLTHDDHPMVIDKLCQNPRVTEQHIMTIITRRPTLPALIETVAAHARWLQRPTVREAIVYNPYGPTGLALRLLPTLSVRTWEAVRFAAQVHPAVQGFAEYLLATRAGEPDAPSPDMMRDTRH
jgi:hypothetical protein